MTKNKLCIVLAGAVLLLAGIFFVYNSIIYRTEISEFDIKASVADAAGITPNSHFILKTTASLTPQVLEKYVKMVPAINLSIKKVSAQENTFEIIPKEELKADQVYTIQVDKGPLASRDFSWAYQVKAPFHVTSSIPKDKGVDVPANTGIELYFNRNDILDPAKYIEISPATPGVFQTSGNVVRFIPSSPLSERVIYTINIKAGLRAKGTDDVFGGQTIQFQTTQNFYQNNQPAVNFSRQFFEFKPGSDILLGLNAYKTSKVAAIVYRFDSAQEFIDSVAKAQGNAPWARYYVNIDDKLLTAKKVFSSEGIPIETADYSSIVRMPQNLPIGYYATVITAGKSTDIAWFQVNPVASFSAFANPRSLLWLKNIDTGTNLAGVPVSFNGRQVGRSGADGVVLFDTPSELIRKPTDPYYGYINERRFFVAEVPTGALVIPVENEYGFLASLNQNDDWWNYVSLNKNIYLPTDTIRFWAIEKSRGGEKIGGDIDVKLTNSYWDGTESNTTMYAETKLKISEYNTITGELPFANLKPGVYSMTFSKGSEVITTQSVTISSYIKPAYKITVIPDKDAIFAGDSVTFKVKAEFFDGTPVADTSFSYSSYFGKIYQGNITLNSQGESSFTITPEYRSNQTYWPSYLSVNVRPTKAEEGQIETTSNVFVFGPNINNSVSQKQTASDVTFSVKTRAVVFNSSSRGVPYWDSEDYLDGPVAGATTRVDVSEVVYIKNQTGTGYDPINKLTYPIYEYETEDHKISTQTITADKNGLAQFVFAQEKNKTYKFIFTSADSAGRTTSDTRYVYGGVGEIDDGLKDYSYSLYNPDGYKDYKIGDTINLQLQTYQGIVPPERQGDYIFITVNNGNIEYRVQDTPKYNSTFQDKNIPNISIWPGWFAGGRFHNSYLQNISFDANERRLNIVVTKDKQTYKPGDEVSLDIRITDKKNNPVKAEVNLSALDEAVFSVRTDETDVVNSLYEDIYSQVMIRTSNMPPYGGGGAEKGGGDGGTPRSNIQEMAIYRSITTDSNGYAHLQFKLPDNITSWRLTSQAVTKNLFAGKNVDFIPVALPVFVDATLNNTYLAGDDLVLRLRTFGTAAGQGNVSYTVESPTLLSKSINKVGGNNIEVPLGALSVGSHQLTVKVVSDGLRDAITRKLNVLGSYFTKNTSDFYEGLAGLKIKNNTIGYTRLTFSSYGRGKLYDQLKSLSYQVGVRLDQKGAQLIATDLLNTYFGEKGEKPEFKATKYQLYTGGLQLLPYSSEDIELSAISAHLFEGLAFDRASLDGYLTQSLSDKSADLSRTVRALYGLASFKEPVLTKIQSIKNDASLTIKDKIFVALALDSIGAKEEARDYYKQTIKPSIQSSSAYAYVGGISRDDTITATALVAALTASLEEPESDQLALYVEQNFPRETLSNFERLLYIKSALPKLDPQEVSFSYKAGSKEGGKVLKNGESFELTLSPQELASFELSDVKGKLGVVASYEQESSPRSISKDKNLSLSRSYEVNGDALKDFSDGDMVLVRLNPHFSTNALSGNYQIVDYLPSGLRPIDQESSGYYNKYDSHVYPTEIDGQKITFVVSKDVALPIYYKARVVSKGTYKAEPALLQSLRSSESATISNEDFITIK